MNRPPDDLTQPIPSDPTAPQAPAPTPDWVRASPVGDLPASDLPGASPTAPVAGSAVPAAAAAAPVAAKTSWRSRLSGGKGLAAGALVVGLGLGAVGGSVATWAVVHDARGGGDTADGRGFDHDGDGSFGRPDGERGGFPPGGGQRPGADQEQGGRGGTLPGGGADANGTSPAT